MTTSPESSAENPAAKPAAKSAQLRGRTEPHMQSINMPQREPIDPYERPSYPFFYVPTDLLIGGTLGHRRQRLLPRAQPLLRPNPRARRRR